MSNVQIGKLHVSEGSLEEIRERVLGGLQDGEKAYCIPLNVTKYSMAKSDPKLLQALQQASYVTADGLPITWLARKLGYSSVQRVTGIDLSEACLQTASEQGHRLYFFGTREEVGQAAIKNLKIKYPGLNVVGYRNGFFDESDVDEIVREINDASPDILFLGLGLPQKEHFIVDHFSAMNVKFCITVGGAIDIWANVKSRAPKFVQRFGMEWIYRSLSNIKKTTDLLAYGKAFASDYFIHCRSLNKPSND